MDSIKTYFYYKNKDFKTYSSILCFRGVFCMRLLKGLATGRRNIVIAIESSCDDACLAIMNTKNEIIHEYKYSQKKLHQPFGGVVPQLAALGHRNSFHKMLNEDLIRDCFKRKLVKYIAVTTGPGIGSCLNVGYEIASQLSRSNNVPLVRINHLVTEFFIYILLFLVGTFIKC